jgi:hypothetical protein
MFARRSPPVSRSFNSFLAERHRSFRVIVFVASTAAATTSGVLTGEATEFDIAIF